MKRTLGVCYYPEHWPMDQWAQDARDMVAAGLSWVRIGEFAWSRLEPSEGDFQFEWLDQAIETLGGAGLKIILGTPTATPPKWVLEKHPDMLAVDEQGQPRKFGSRRHYCFSHEGYKSESRRITRILAKRYGKNPHIAAWQTDNEYGCHDTTRSYSNAARVAFQDWLAQRYQSTDAMNRAWGNVFWSMEYDTFDQVDLPNLTVTEPNHPHMLAFRRFSSDQVVVFNRIQVDEIRAHSDAPIIHNYMGRVTDFDHYAVGADLDIASWDSYPIGFLSDRLEASDEHKARYLRQGDPDMQAFHHDLYRAVGKGRWWIMEQQPGPVNWAPYNPAPLNGMARLWAWEAFAHGAETVCYFRWRQAPFAQEQMHAGLQRPDGVDAPAMAECKQVADEIAQLSDVGTVSADVALIFDYHSCWAWESQPQGADFDMFRLALATYRALRRAGLSVDIISPQHAIDGYKLVLAPGLMHIHDDLHQRLAEFDGLALLGPRTGLKTDELSIPIPMGPNVPMLDATVSLLESIPPNSAIALDGGGQFLHWFEHLEGQGEVVRKTRDGKPAIMRAGGLHYMAGWPDDDTYLDIVKTLCSAIDIETFDLPEGLRVRDTPSHRFYINYAPEPCEFDGVRIDAADVVWVERG